MYQENPIVTEGLLDAAIFKAAKENPFKFKLAKLKLGVKTPEEAIALAQNKINQAKATMPPEKYAFYEKEITNAVQNYMNDSDLMSLVSKIKSLF